MRSTEQTKSLQVRRH